LLSPTAANDLIACGYRTAWRLDARFTSLRRPTPWSALGTVAHGVVEDVARGLIADSADKLSARRVVEEAWDRRVATEVARLSAAWRPAMPPSPDEWPGYHLTRARTIRRAVRRRRQRAERASVGTRTLVEYALTDGRLGLQGRVDRVEGPADDRCVVDLKTGLAQAEPTPEQRRQLLLYAHLVGVDSGVVPARVAIEDAAGRRWEQAITKDEVDDVVIAVVEARSSYADAANAESLPSLAKPGPAVCRNCPFRPVCGPYWLALSTDWAHGSAAGVVGAIVSSGPVAIIRLDAESPSDEAGEWVVSMAPARAAVEGDRVGIVDAERTGAPRSLRWRWSTLWWRQPTP
jgi:RecB family exonuclease